MTSIASYTSPALIVPQMDGRNAREALAELGSRLHLAGKVPEASSFLDAVMRREMVCSTVTEPDWALPHARLEGVNGISFALGRSRDPIHWLNRSGTAVRMVFLSAVPQEEPGEYLRMLSGLARLCTNASLCEQLQRAPGTAEIYRLLEQVVLPTPGLARS